MARFVSSKQLLDSWLLRGFTGILNLGVQRGIQDKQIAFDVIALDTLERAATMLKIAQKDLDHQVERSYSPYEWDQWFADCIHRLVTLVSQRSCEEIAMTDTNAKFLENMSKELDSLINGLKELNRRV